MVTHRCEQVTLILRCPYHRDLIQIFFTTVGNYLGLSQSDRNSEVVVLVR